MVDARVEWFIGLVTFQVILYLTALGHPFLYAELDLIVLEPSLAGIIGTIETFRGVILQTNIGWVNTILDFAQVVSVIIIIDYIFQFAKDRGVL